MSTPTELFNSMVNAAKAAQDQAAAQEAAARQAAANQGLTDLTTTIAKTAETTEAISKRLEALEAASRPAPNPAQGGNGSNPLNDFETLTGIPTNAFTGAASTVARTEAEKVFEEKFGPLLREQQAVNEYSSKNPDFNAVAMQKYLATNPEAANVVREAAARGAYTAAIEYAETSRKLDAAIKQEAKGQHAKDARKQFVENTRPDAQVVGSGGSGNPAGLNVNPAPLSAEKIQHAFAHLNAGNAQPFVDAFVNPTLPSEEEFQRMVQGPFA